MRTLMRCSAAAAAAVVVALALSACGSDDSSSSSAPDTSGAAASISKMAIAAPEKANDYGWNQQGVESVRCSAGWRRAAAS
jgi:basic membrane lipoprotein Med (substrate-binding protein (PBP1-ABC) superfamily)